MWQRLAFVITVVLMGFSGGVLALFVRGMHAGRGAVASFCFVSALLSCRLGWLPPRSPKPAGCAATFEMHAIEELKRNFVLFPSSDCVQSWRSFPCR